jgi:hypothetical protein
VHPIVRKVESDAKVMAVKSWVEIVREHHESQQREHLPVQNRVNDQPPS